MMKENCSWQRRLHAILRGFDEQKRQLTRCRTDAFLQIDTCAIVEEKKVAPKVTSAIIRRVCCATTGVAEIEFSRRFQRTLATLHRSCLGLKCLIESGCAAISGRAFDTSRLHKPCALYDAPTLTADEVSHTSSETLCSLSTVPAGFCQCCQVFARTDCAVSTVRTNRRLNSSVLLICSDKHFASESTF